MIQPKPRRLPQEQPNTDLLVDDKYTGKIAYRVAQAKAADIDRHAPASCGRGHSSAPYPGLVQSDHGLPLHTEQGLHGRQLGHCTYARLRSG